MQTIPILYFLLAWFLRIIAFGAIALFFTSICYEIATYKKQKALRQRSLWISIGIAIALLIVFRFIGGIRFGRWWLSFLILPMAGAGVGLFLGKTRKLTSQAGKVYSQGTIWYILVWALTMLFLQLFYLFNLVGVTNVIFYILMFSTSLLVVTNLLLILRARKLLKSASPPAQ